MMTGSLFSTRARRTVMGWIHGLLLAGMVCLPSTSRLIAQTEVEEPESTSPEEVEDAVEEPSEMALGVDAFALITQRNIFDPQRRSALPRTERREEASPPRREMMRLTGTLLNNDQAVAFFEGSDRNVGGVYKIGDKVGGLALAEVTSVRVVLSSETNRIELSVGKRLTRSGDAPWMLAEAGEVEVRSSTSGDPGASEGVKSGGGEAGTGEDMSEVMKRLLERRKQELEQ